MKMKNDKIKREPAYNIKIWNGRNYIKIDNKFIRLSHYLVEKHIRLLIPGEIVHHKDEDKLHDEISNYEIWTNSEHTIYHNKGKKRSKETRKKLSIAHKGIKQSKETKRKIAIKLAGENSYLSKLTQREVNMIRHLYFWHNGWNYDKLAKKYNVWYSNIGNIINGRSWNPNKLTKQKIINKSKVVRTPILLFNS